MLVSYRPLANSPSPKLETRLRHRRDEGFGSTNRVMALYRLAQAAAKRWPTAVALRSQTEALTLDFATLESRAAATAAVLQSKGLEAGQVLVSDLQNTSQNLVVQLACSSLGVACLSRRPARELIRHRRDTLPTPNPTQMARPRTTPRSPSSLLH